MSKPTLPGVSAGEDEANAPPRLDGEVWRGLDSEGEPVAVAKVGEAHIAFWWDCHHDYEWFPATFGDYIAAILTAWALHERAVAAEERAALEAK